MMPEFYILFVTNKTIKCLKQNEGSKLNLSLLNEIYEY